jgi:hypothetical protein
MTSISFAELPMTFRDAITLSLTHRLGIHYIRIDALRVIQDSPDDWEQESARMSGVYSGSYLNISASTSSDAQGGLYRRRNPLCWTSCIKNTKWRGVGNDKLTWSPLHSPQSTNNCPVRKTAWWMQERLLAARTLHFCESQIYWECNKSTAS